MCVYTEYIKNPKYKPNKKNNYNAPICKDGRLLYVPIKCGKCYQCRKERARNWSIRLCEEIKTSKNPYFITLTFSNAALSSLANKAKNNSENQIVTKAVDLYLDRYRKKTGKKLKHWFITELGEQKGRIHLHGIIWGDIEAAKSKWEYGNVFVGAYVNEKTINYIVKYMIKINEINKKYIPIVLCSKGIGKGYEKNKERHKYAEGGKTIETYRYRNGSESALPQYYRNKVFTEEEKEKLWIEKQERGYRYIGRKKVSLDDEEKYMIELKVLREKYQRIGGDEPKEWDREKHLNKLRRMKKEREKIKERS